MSTQNNTPAAVSDAVLVDRLRGGDAAAGTELVRRYSAALLRYLQKLVSSDHLAEELHQQTWMSVLEHVDRFDAGVGSGGFKSWLYRIATNKANDYWRFRGREKTAKEGVKLIIDEAFPDASQDLQSAEEAEKLRGAIEKLPETQKQVLLLRYYGGMKFVEIAQTLGCPLNTALGRMHKAMIR